MIKHNIVTTLVLGSSLFASQSILANCPNNSSMEISLTGAAFKPAAENTTFGILAQNAIDVPPSGALLNVPSDNEFGGAVLLAYHFASSPYLVAFSYWGVDFNPSESAAGSIGVTAAPSTYSIDFATDATSELNFHNNIYNLMFGAQFCPSKCINFTPKLGITYFDVKNNQTSTYTGGDVTAGNVLVISDNSSFKGTGPAIGFDLDFQIGCNFSLFASMNYAALIGDIDSDYSVNASQENPPTVNLSSTIQKSIVNLVQSEIALSYTFITCPSYLAKAMIGYSVTKTFGTSETGYLFADDVADSNLVSVITNTGFHGPFARVSLDFDI